MNQVDKPCEPSITETNKIVSDVTQGKEVEGKHPDIKRTDEKSDLPVEDHPVEPLENHKSSQEERTGQLGIQTRTASVRHYSDSDMN